MIQRILLATNGGYLAAGAVRVAAALAERTGAIGDAVTVFESNAPLPAPVNAGDRWEADDQEAVRALRERVSAHSRRVFPAAAEWPLHVTGGDPAAGIERVAQEIGADLIITGIGQSAPADRRIDGGTPLRLAYTGSVPVLAVAPDADGLPHAVVIDANYDIASVRATRLALELVASPGTAYLTYVRRRPGIPRHDDPDESSWAIGHLLDELPSSPPRDVIVQHLVLDGDPLMALLAAARERDAELIATGLAGTSAEIRSLTANNAAGLLRGSPVSVLVVPERIGAMATRTEAPRAEPDED